MPSASRPSGKPECIIINFVVCAGIPRKSSSSGAGRAPALGRVFERDEVSAVVAMRPLDGILGIAPDLVELAAESFDLGF
jgi:hypothetical protein